MPRPNPLSLVTRVEAECKQVQSLFIVYFELDAGAVLSGVQLIYSR